MTKVIQGGIHKDSRGRLIHFNHFNMSPVKRMYSIEFASGKESRAWVGHQKEKKWFYCYQGRCIIKIISIDNWENPSKDLVALGYELSEENPSILSVSEGNVIGFKPLQSNTKITVFSDFLLEDSLNDDFRFPLDYWDFNK